MQVDEVARLFSAEAQAVVAQRRDDGAIADVAAHDVDTDRPQGPFEAEIAHAGRDDLRHDQLAALREVARPEIEHRVAVVNRPAFVEQQRAVGVAVEGEAEVEVAGREPRGERFRVGRAAVAVDVLTVRRGEEELDLGAEPGEELAGDPRGGAVRGVEGDSHPSERPASAGFADQPPQVAPARFRIGRAGGARRRARQPDGGRPGHSDRRAGPRAATRPPSTT